MFRRVDGKLDLLLSGSQTVDVSPNFEFEQLDNYEEFKELEIKLQENEYRTLLSHKLGYYQLRGISIGIAFHAQIKTVSIAQLLLIIFVSRLRFSCRFSNSSMPLSHASAQLFLLVIILVS